MTKCSIVGNAARQNGLNGLSTPRLKDLQRDSSASNQLRPWQLI